MPPGFTSERQLHCTQFSDMAVEPDDGCTFGMRGEPVPACQDYFAVLSTHPSDGWRSYD